MSLARQRMIENFSRAANDYDARAEFQHGETLRVLDAALMFFPPQARVLDVGCGTGYFAVHAQEKRPQWSIDGVDIAPGMCAVAATRCQAIQADAAALPFANASYDAVVSSLCLQWMPNVAQAISEMARVLRPGGRMVIASLGPNSLGELKRITQAVNLPLPLLAMPPAEDYRAAIEAHGLHVTRFEQTLSTSYYTDVRALLNSMRRIGAGNPVAPASIGAQRYKALLAEYEKLRARQGITAQWERLFMVLHKPL